MPRAKPSTTSSGWVEIAEKDQSPFPDFGGKKHTNPSKLADKYRDAVVRIHSEFTLVQTGYPTVPGADDPRYDNVVRGNGFFIKHNSQYYIVCPASLVLIPPTLLLNANRYPYVSISTPAVDPIPENRVYPNTTTKVGRILVDVSVDKDNKHAVDAIGRKKRHTFTYEATLIGVDGAGDAALLSIDHSRPWNLTSPPLENQSHFEWGRSRKAQIGEPIYTIGDHSTGNDDLRLPISTQAFAAGHLGDNRHTDHQGLLLTDSVIADFPGGALKVGAPLFDKKGRVLGMQTTDGGTKSYVAGPSEFSIRRLVGALVPGPGCNKDRAEQVVTVDDLTGSYGRYTKGYAGIAYDVFNGGHIDTTTNFTTGEIKVRYSPDGRFHPTPHCKDLLGVRVLAVAGGSRDSIYFTPGQLALLGGRLPVLPDSPFLKLLQQGDVIAYIDGMDLGDLHQQVAPYVVTWVRPPGTPVNVVYRRGGNSSGTGDYSDFTNVSARLAEFPPLMDYPWYAVSIWPEPSGLFNANNPPNGLPTPNFRPAF